MRTRVAAAALAGLLALPAAGQDAGPQEDGGATDAMTCGEFLALDEAGQLEAMLALRAAYNGEPLEAAPAGGGTGEAEEAAVAEDGAAGTAAVASPTAARLSGMRTSCAGAAEVPALDAMIAAHADYE